MVGKLQYDVRLDYLGTSTTLSFPLLAVRVNGHTESQRHGPHLTPNALLGKEQRGDPQLLAIRNGAL